MDENGEMLEKAPSSEKTCLKAYKRYGVVAVNVMLSLITVTAGWLDSKDIQWRIIF